MAEFCDNFAVSRAASGIGLQFAINYIERPKGRADRRPGEGLRKDSRDRDGKGNAAIRKRTLRPMPRQAGVRKHF